MSEILTALLERLLHHLKHVPVELATEAIKRHREHEAGQSVEDIKSLDIQALLADLRQKVPAEMPASEADESKGRDSHSNVWVLPVEGNICPAGYPIKGSAKYIYHVPGGRFYANTHPVRCFATEADAEAAGFRASRR